MTTPEQRPNLVDTDVAALAVHRPSGTIRRWAAEGDLPRRGRDRRGRTLYDLGEVYRLASTRAAARPRPEGNPWG